MKTKLYYSQRIGNVKPLELKNLRVAFKSVYEHFRERHYFIDFLGKGRLSQDGIIGNSFEAFCMRKINRSINSPSMALSYNEEDIFDVIELLYEYINYPNVIPSTTIWESDEITVVPEKKEIAQKQFRDQINVFLNQYSDGWELSEEGYIRNILEEGFIELVDNTAVYGDENNIDSKIRRAKDLFLRRGSSLEDKKMAIREIGDALEFIREDLKESIGKNESDIFNLLNNFSIRHNNASQKSDYNLEVYIPWIFYTFLSTYDAYVKLMKKKRNTNIIS